MLPKLLLQKLRKYEIRIRKSVNAQMQGDFHSVFKGTGLEFEDVRSYQYGDDVRSIDWNVTAKGHGTFVKLFREEKEQNVFFILDVSASGKIGSSGRTKLDTAMEICGVLALSAVKEKSHTGLIGYSDQKELYVKPGKGEKHAISLIKSIFSLKASSKGTNLTQSIRMALKLLKRKSVVILISDFIDEGYEDALKVAATKHDLVIIQVMEKKEGLLAGLGIIPVYQIEDGRTLWLNTASSTHKKRLSEQFSLKSSALQQLSHRYNANYVQVFTDEDFTKKLVELFKNRKKK